jgi:hypothetical protein
MQSKASIEEDKKFPEGLYSAKYNGCCVGDGYRAVSKK